MSSWCFLNVLRTFCRIFPGCFQDAPMGLVDLVEFDDQWPSIISNDSMDFNDPKELDDPQLLEDPSYSMIPSQLFNHPQLFDDRLEVWTLTIQKYTVIPPSLMVLFCSVVLMNDNIWEIFAPWRRRQQKKLFWCLFKSRVWLASLQIFNFDSHPNSLHDGPKRVPNGQKSLR